ncbi:major facilitator superfamily domain-containing protein [Exophiala viscosa]|uniref:Major facilitator superfamily domain-containing protein n=1 Tax=Exophiala viscosa TaxID=2486360 RepID=A0AAN6DLW6_9EURO|nr:major facilitator superfamily domain-containing protein [Exophiala viscosa]
MAPEASRTTAEDDDAFPYRQLAVLAICRLAEPIAFTSITAYTFVMVQDIKGDEDASFYAGLLISAFAMAEASTAMIWGSISDRYGRKPIILVALAGTALSSLIFGFAKKYWVALLARVIGGALNGNVAVMQTMVAEMIKNPDHEPAAYSVQPFMWSLGSIVGSALGGFTAQPAKFYPHVFDPNGIFGEYPYLLPNIVSVVAIVIAMIQGWILLEETNPAAKSLWPASMSRTSDSHIVDERTPLAQRRDRRESNLTAFSVGGGSIAYAVSSAPLPNDPSFDLRRRSIASITSFKPLHHTMTPTVDVVIEDNEFQAPKSDSIKAFNKGVIFWTVALVLMCYHQMAFYALFPIYLLDDPRQPPQHLDLVGGLGLTLPTVGVFLAANSVLSLFVQGVIFPIYVSKFGVWKAALSLTIVAPIAHLLVPFVTMLPNPGIGMCVLLALQSCTAIIIYPSLLILLKNATESPLVLGRVNGLAMSACSAARTVAPPLVGIFYSGLGSAGAWWSSAVIAIVAIIELFFAPRPKEDDATIMRRASMAVEVAPTINGASD